MPDRKPDTKNLPGSAAARLARIADATDEISYADIEAFDAAWPDMKPEKALNALHMLNCIGDIDPETVRGNDDAMDAVRALARAIRPAEEDGGCVCPFCGSDIPEEDIDVDEWTGVAEATCPRCGKSYDYLADG